MLGLWTKIKDAEPYEKIQQLNERGLSVKKRYDEFDAMVNIFNKALAEVLATITKEAQQLYDMYFAQNDAAPIQFGVVMRKQTSPFERTEHKFDRPEIGFEIKVGETPLPRPHTLLNEAKLTQLALSVRFGATLGSLT